MGRGVDPKHYERNTSEYKTEEKAGFNEIFSNAVRKQYRKRVGKVGYLDYRQLATTKALLSKKIKKKHLRSPNLDKEVVAALQKKGVVTSLASVEEHLEDDNRGEYIAYYYDGCGSPLGNNSSNIFPMNSISAILNNFDRAGDSILACTVTLRGGRKSKLNSDDLEEKFVAQMKNLVAYHGFEFEEIHYERYLNASQCQWLVFLCWKLKPSSSVGNKITFLPAERGKGFFGFRDE